MPHHQAFPFLLPSLTFLLSSKRQCFLSLGNCHISLLQASGKHGISEFSPSLFLTSNLIYFFFFSAFLFICVFILRSKGIFLDLEICLKSQSVRLYRPEGFEGRMGAEIGDGSPRGGRSGVPLPPPALHNHRAPTDITLGQRGKKSNPVLIFLTSINF